MKWKFKVLSPSAGEIMKHTVSILNKSIILEFNYTVQFCPSGITSVDCIALKISNLFYYHKLEIVLDIQKC